MMIGLSRRWLRQLGYLVAIVFTLILMVLFAHKNEVINLEDYLPKDITPQYFQPPSDIYIIDISIASCYKSATDCGIPKPEHGKLGNLYKSGGWIKLNKDLALGSSWFKKQYFSYKHVKSQALSGRIEGRPEEKNQDSNKVRASIRKKTSTDIDKKVIIDIAVANPRADSKIKNNKLNLPVYIIEQYNRDKVYSDSDHHELIELSTDKPLKEDLKHLQEIDEARQKQQDEETHAQIEAQEKAKEQEKQQNEKVEDLEAVEQDKQIEHDKELQDEMDNKVITPELDIDPKKVDKIENNESSEDLLKQDPPQEDPVQNADAKDEDAKDGSQNKLEKRKTETSRDALERLYYIPTKHEIEVSGWVQKSNGIWLKYGAANNEAITAIDILFGEDCVEPRPNWKLIKTGSISGLSTPSDKPAYITYRRGAKVDYQAHEYQKKLKFNVDGKFKILQVADLHFSTGVGVCRDPSPSSTKKGCEADPRTLKFLNKVLDIEKPDFVVLTGDQIFGQSSPDSETSVFKALDPFIKRKIPFAVTLGNHDDEGSLTREEVMKLSVNLPFSLAKEGPSEVEGVGNYMLHVESYSTNKPKMTMYFLDTHKYSPSPKTHPGYDWVKESQLRFLEREHGALEELIPNYDSKYLSMAFFHIPLPEYRNLDQKIVGEQREGITAPNRNTGTRKLLGQMGVKVVSVGHDHCNDYCLRDTLHGGNEEMENIWLCYGGGSGEGGYGGYGGYIRKLRIFEINENEGKISSWKRQEDNPDSAFDHQDIVDQGLVV